jgi:diguanylate cyclase (GGDEF)-like protein
MLPRLAARAVASAVLVAAPWVATAHPALAETAGSGDVATRVEAARTGALVHAAEETAWLLRLGAFADDVPPEVRALPERLALPLLPRDDMIERLAAADANGVRDLATLRDLGVDVPPPVRTVLGPLPAHAIDELRSNEPPTLLGKPHVDALEMLRRPLPDDVMRRVVAPDDAATSAEAGGGSAGTWQVVAAVGGIALVATGAALWWTRRAAGRLAYVDELTGVGNRRRLDRDLSTALRDVSGASGARPVTLAMIDLDHFKALNDEHGHLVGDQVLRTVAGIIAASVRSTDVVYRYGGEEFCVLLRDTEPAVARAVAERLRDAIERTVFDIAPGCQVSITASIGLAAAQSDDASSVLGDADRALYGAKRSGRNRVEAALA